MLLADVLAAVERFAPAYLAQEWDNSGLEVGDERSSVARVLVSLELNPAVLAEAESLGCQMIVTHHPLLFSPVRSLVESKPKERLLRGLVRSGVALVACHTNADAAAGGLAEIAGRALGLEETEPLVPEPTGWYKLVGYIPVEAVETVATAVFGAGAGGVGSYSDCAFKVEGEGRFKPGAGSRPTIGRAGKVERTREARWETVVPRCRRGEVARAFVNAHPYEEPAFDLYPVEDMLPHVGLGRVGALSSGCGVEALAQRVKGLFDVSRVIWSGNADAPVRRVAVLPGSGRGSVAEACGRCEALITGDLSYHDAEQAGEAGLALIDVPHGEMEWWAFRQWGEALGAELVDQGVTVMISEVWSPPWKVVV